QQFTPNSNTSMPGAGGRPQQYDHFNQGPLMHSTASQEMQLQQLWTLNYGPSTTAPFPTTSHGAGTPQNSLSAPTMNSSLLQLPQLPPYPPVQSQSHAPPAAVPPIEVILQQLRDWLSRQLWVRNQEPEPVMQEDDPLVQMRLVEPGMSRFEAFIAWD
ncbi:hypothetical protein FRC17_008334, partial [Serendipita sp. 399]